MEKMKLKMGRGSNYQPPISLVILLKPEGVICGSPTGSGEDRDPWE